MSKIIPANVIEAAQLAQVKWWVPSSVAIAQWALESNYGASMPPGSNNPFGIKAVAGQASVSTGTHEEVDGKMVATTAAFAKYADLDDAFNAYGKLLHTNSHYKHAMAARMNADDFANELTGVYATDSHYGEKLIALMKLHDLYQYNSLKGSVMATAAPVKTPGTKTAVWLNLALAMSTALAGFTQYLPPQYAAAGVGLSLINGLLHQFTGQASAAPPV